MAVIQKLLSRKSLTHESLTHESLTHESLTHESLMDWRMCFRRALREEVGSLSILITALFFLLLLSSFIAADTSDAFLAKRELVGVGEVAITSAAHQISLSRYYSGNIMMDTSGADGPLFRIPIDCEAALNSFTSEIIGSNLRGRPIAVDSWNCAGDGVKATISSLVPALIKFPLGIGGEENLISSTIGATSIIGGYR
jgi:hypothetical protein